MICENPATKPQSVYGFRLKLGLRVCRGRFAPLIRARFEWVLQSFEGDYFDSLGSCQMPEADNHLGHAASGTGVVWPAARQPLAGVFGSGDRVAEQDLGFRVEGLG